MASKARSVSIREAALISGLERVIPGYVRENNPNLVSQLKDEILENYVVIDKAEIIKDTFQTVSLKFPGVKRGDLITADLMNQIIQAIENLDERVTALESGAVGDRSVVITALQPTGALHLGDTLTVLGRNFEYSIGGHRVYIDGIRVKSFKEGSNDEKLIFEIPKNITNVPDDGKEVTLSISNTISTSTVDITVLPIQFPLQGNIEVGYQSVVPETLEAGSSATFRYKVKSKANQIATFEIVPEITGISNQEEWQNKLQILDDSGNQITDGKIPLEPEIDSYFKIRITSIPSSPPNATFTLTVSVVALGVTGLPDVRNFKVGAVAEQQDENIDLSYWSTFPPAAYDESDGKIKIAEESSAKVTFRAEFFAIGFYVISEKILSGENWSVVKVTASTKEIYEITEADLANVSTRQKLLKFLVTANGGASDTGKMEVSIQRKGAAKRKSKEMDLVKI